MFKDDRTDYRYAGAIGINDALKQLNEKESELNFQLYSGLAKVEAGGSQLELVLGQLDGTLEQLDDAEQQIEDAKQQAYDAADVHGIVTLEMVSGLLSAQNFSMPAGYVTEEDVEYLVRVGEKYTSDTEITSMLLFDPGIEDVEPIYLTDVADVFTSDNSDSIYAKIDGRDGVLLSFSKQSNYATADVSGNILEKFEELKKDYEGLTFTPLMDQGDYIHIVVGSVLDNLLIGAALAVFVLFIFLRDIRPTLVVGVSIPISVTFAIVLMYFSGVTLNVISLAGLAVGVGMLVDNSIVVIENIYRLRG